MKRTSISIARSEPIDVTRFSSMTRRSFDCSPSGISPIVEEERPAVGRLEQAAARLAGAREGALPEAEQLRLEQLFRDRRAVHRDERLVAPSAREVERAREQLLANARLAVDQHGRVEPGNRVEQLEDVLHHLALREDVLEREPLLVA